MKMYAVSILVQKDGFEKMTHKVVPGNDEIEAENNALRAEVHNKGEGIDLEESLDLDSLDGWDYEISEVKEIDKDTAEKLSCLFVGLVFMKEDDI